MADFQICELWFQIVQRFGAVFGQPLPSRVLALGSADRGWGVQLNASDREEFNFPRYSVVVHWNGFPAGVVDANGGLIAAGELANEAAFRRWLPTAEPCVDSVPV